MQSMRRLSAVQLRQQGKPQTALKEQLQRAQQPAAALALKQGLLATAPLLQARPRQTALILLVGLRQTALLLREGLHQTAPSLFAHLRQITEARASSCKALPQLQLALELTLMLQKPLLLKLQAS